MKSTNINKFTSPIPLLGGKGVKSPLGDLGVHSLKMIWAERKSNIWIMLELIVIFTILWFCSGFMYEIVKKFVEPVGVDIKHTYVLRFNFDRNLNMADYQQDYDYAQDGITILERLKQHPAIESACVSLRNSTPYTGSYSGAGVEKDSINYPYQTRKVSPEFFDVYKINFQSGRTFDANEVLSKNQVVASPIANNTFFTEDITSLKEIIKHELEPGYHPKTNEEYEQAPKIEIIWKVTGVVNKIKRSEVFPYERNIFFPISRNEFHPRQIDFSIRVKPQADKNFIETFKKEMNEQLKVGPFELLVMLPVSDIRDVMLRETDEKIETISAVIIFLMINVFLGIVGTFRFRANARRGEIGLRCAMGSSKNKIQQLLLSETFMILLLASIPATIIALNIQMLGLLSNLGISILDVTENSMSQEKGVLNKSMFLFNLITYLITFVTMLVIIWLGTWYPAKKASEIQPAEALHYE